MKKIIIIVPLLILLGIGVMKGKSYYEDRYDVSDTYYTQIPLDTVNKDSKLVDSQGKPVEDGKSYEFIGYNKDGKMRKVNFFKKGKKEDYYKPGTFIKADVSKTITLKTQVIDENKIPEKALKTIQTKGTKIK